ncbi:MAG: sigma-70 family RNA polymerase sigma factor [Pirellulaceae bacterium]|nr:sigma-70 family RNA polymerase sigma factor [Planctomycetaceae bacterium]
MPPKKLLARFRAGESRAANEVVDRYVARLVGFVRQRISPNLQRRVDAEDVVQSAMLSFFVRASSDAYVLDRAGDLWRLLTTITLHKLRRQVEVHTAAKRAVRREEYGSVEASLLSAAVDREPLPGDAAALMDELQQVMQNCSPPERFVLQLRLAGETIETIAESTDRSQRTVRRLLQNCREQLERRLLMEKEPDE